MSAPNPDDPLANDVAELWKKDEVTAIKNGMRIERAAPVDCSLPTTIAFPNAGLRSIEFLNTVMP
jgi:hypothetical protein